MSSRGDHVTLHYKHRLRVSDEAPPIYTSPAPRRSPAPKWSKLGSQFVYSAHLSSSPVPCVKTSWRRTRKWWRSREADGEGKKWRDGRLSSSFFSPSLLFSRDFVSFVFRSQTKEKKSKKPSRWAHGLFVCVKLCQWPLLLHISTLSAFVRNSLGKSYSLRYSST